MLGHSSNPVLGLIAGLVKPGEARQNHPSILASVALGCLVEDVNTRGAVGRLVALCAHLAAVLPYKRADEPLVVVYNVNTIVSRRGEDVLSALKASLAGSTSVNEQVHSYSNRCPLPFFAPNVYGCFLPCYALPAGCN